MMISTCFYSPTQEFIEKLGESKCRRSPVKPKKRELDLHVQEQVINVYKGGRGKFCYTYVTSQNSQDCEWASIPLAGRKLLPHKGPNQRAIHSKVAAILGT